jgi:hypothetical protein
MVHRTRVLLIQRTILVPRTEKVRTYYVLHNSSLHGAHELRMN